MRFGQNETDYFRHGVGVADKEAIGRIENHCENYRGTNYRENNKKQRLRETDLSDGGGEGKGKRNKCQ